MSQSQKQSAKERLAVAKKLDDADKTITAIKEIINEYPRFIFGLIELGLAYRLKGDRLEALKTFELAEKIYPKNKEIKFELLKEQLHFNKFADYRSTLEQLIEIVPHNVGVMIDLGKVYRRENKAKVALELFAKALQLNPQAKEASINLAEQFIQAGDFAQAAKYLEQALKLAPNDFKILLWLGKLERERHRLDIALDYLQKAIASDRQQVSAHLLQIDTLWDLGLYDRARYNLETIHNQHPKNFAIVLRCGHLARKMGQREQALQQFYLAKSIAVIPAQDLTASNLIAEEMKALGRLDEALKVIDLAIEQHSSDFRAYLLKGNILQSRAKFEEAAKIYQHILSIEPERIDARNELAKIYSRFGQIERAIDLLKETNLLRADLKILIQLGLLYQTLEKYRIASTWYRQACWKFPDHHHGYCKLASLLFLQGNAEGAVRLLQKARERLPDNSQIAQGLIELQIRLGNFDWSEQLLKKECRRFPHNVQLSWQFCQLKIKQGEYQTALNILDRISSDNPEWLRRSQQLRTTIYFLQYDYPKAEKHLRNAIELAATAISERVRLAYLLLLTCRIDEALQELKIATEGLILLSSPGKSNVPLKSNTAMVINQLRMNPPMLKKLVAIEQSETPEKIIALGHLLAQEPQYFGAALYLAKELREQGIFESATTSIVKKIRHHCSNSPKNYSVLGRSSTTIRN